MDFRRLKRNASADKIENGEPLREDKSWRQQLQQTGIGKNTCGFTLATKFIEKTIQKRPLVSVIDNH